MPIDPMLDRAYPCPQCGHVIYVQMETVIETIATAPSADVTEHEYTIAETAKLLRYSKRWIRQLVRERRLRAVRADNKPRSAWRIPESAIREFREQRPTNEA